MVIKLTEAFSKGLPQWLLKGLGLLGRGNNKYWANELTKLGIDPANAEYIPADTPASGRDPFFKDLTKLPVYRLQDNRVYIPGYNDGGMVRYNGEYWYYKDLSRKALLSMTTEFGYLVPSNEVAELRKQRKANKPYDRKKAAQHRQPEYNNTKEDGSRDWDNPSGYKWVTNSGYDKSGYKLDPEKYVRKLNEIGLNNYSAKLERYYKMIADAQSKLSTVLTNYDLQSDLDNRYGSWSSGSPFKDLANYLDRAIYSYKELVRDINRALKQREANPERYATSEDSFLSAIFASSGGQIYRSIRDFNEELKQLNK